MDIRLMNRAEFERSKELWAECFPGDGKNFIDAYYTKRTRPEYVLGAFPNDGEEPAAMLHLLPMQMMFNGVPKHICFIAGVCTKPAFRRRGICAKLFKAAMPIIEERGFEAAVLQPFDTSFYARFGFRTFIRRQRATLSAERPNCFVRVYDGKQKDKADPEKMLSIYSTFMERFSGYSIRDESHMQRMIEEFSTPEARLVVKENGCCAGYIEGEDGGTFRAYELFYSEGAEPAALLPEGFKKYIFPLPEGARVPCGSVTETESFSMILPVSLDFDPGRGPFYGFDMY